MLGLLPAQNVVKQVATNNSAGSNHASLRVRYRRGGGSGGIWLSGTGPDATVIVLEAG